MSEIGLTSSKNYSDIAEAIRDRLGDDDTYLPSEMAEKILSISTKVITDKTLTLEDVPADAKAVGDRLKVIESSLDATGIPDQYTPMANGDGTWSWRPLTLNSDALQNMLKEVLT